MKANLWAYVGKPAKGFSIALRAANAAYTHMLQPLMWAAVAALAAVLDQMQEFAAARQLLDSILPRVRNWIESTSSRLTGHRRLKDQTSCS